MLKIDQISIELNLDKSHCRDIIESLINKRLCLEKDVPWRKNAMIDNLAIILEQPFEAARTK